MSDLRQAAQQALEALEGEPPGWRTPAQERAITALRAALEQPDRHTLQADGNHPAPCARHCEAQAYEIEIRRLEAALKEKNHDQP